MIVVIGAGPAGLSLAYHLQRDVVVLEREQTWGGLCRSFDLAGATFDLGGHAFFTRHAEVKELLEATCPMGLHYQPRRAFVASHDTFVPYPFQSNLYGLPIPVVQECLVGAVDQVRRPPGAPATTLAEWIEQAFGPGVARHFLRPYNEKVWAHPLDEVAPSWVDDRIVQPEVADMIEGALRRRDYVDMPNATVGYPAHGGFVGLFAGLADAVGFALRTATVVRVDLSERVVVTDAGDEHAFDELVSTIPLPELVRITSPCTEHLEEIAASLRHNSLRLVNVVVDGAATSAMHRVYSADPAVPFHKLVLSSNSSPALANAGVFGLQAEISYSPYKPVPDDLESAVTDSIRRLGIIDDDDTVVATSTVDVTYAYPVATASTIDAVAALREHYLDHGVHVLGRFGEWAYINSDEAVRRGRDLAIALGS